MPSRYGPASERRKVRDKILSQRESFPLPELVGLLAQEYDLPRVTIVTILIQGLGDRLFDEPQPGTHVAAKGDQVGIFDNTPSRPTGWWREYEAGPPSEHSHPFGGPMTSDDPLIFGPDVVDFGSITRGGFADISISREGLDRFFSRQTELPRPTFLSPPALAPQERTGPAAQRKKFKLTPGYAVEILKPLDLGRKYPRFKWAARQLADLLDALTEEIPGFPRTPRKNQRWMRKVQVGLAWPAYEKGERPTDDDDRVIHDLIAKQPRPSEFARSLMQRP